MKTFDAGTLGAGDGEPERELTFLETVHGPVSGTVTVHGQPYAIATDRSTRGREPAGELAFSDFDSNRVHSPAAVLRSRQRARDDVQHRPTSTASTSPTSRPGACRSLAPGTDPSLPTLGTGQYDWRGFLSLEQHPHEVEPRSGRVPELEQQARAGMGCRL